VIVPSPRGLPAPSSPPDLVGYRTIFGGDGHPTEVPSLIVQRSTSHTRGNSPAGRPDIALIGKHIGKERPGPTGLRPVVQGSTKHRAPKMA
jgi:hypothetical protein